MEFVCKNPECPRYDQRDYYSSVSVVMRDGKPFCKQSPCPACGKIREEIKKEIDHLIKKIQNLQSDVLEFQNIYYQKERKELTNWYLKDTEDYTGIHLYFKNKSHFYYPWELQIWDKNDIFRNIESHKRDYARKLDNNN